MWYSLLLGRRDPSYTRFNDVMPLSRSWRAALAGDVGCEPSGNGGVMRRGVVSAFRGDWRDPSSAWRGDAPLRECREPSSPFLCDCIVPEQFSRPSGDLTMQEELIAWQLREVSARDGATV